MSKIQCGWLSPSGEFTECDSYEHAAIAETLVPEDVLPYVADDYLLEHGWVKVYKGSFFDHKWHVLWQGFLSEQQKIYLRPIFDDSENDLYVYCRYSWEGETN